MDCACQDPLSMGYSKQEYWNGLPFPPPGDLPNPRIKPASLMSPALAGRFFTTNTIWEAPKHLWDLIKDKILMVSPQPYDQGNSPTESCMVQLLPRGQSNTYIVHSKNSIKWVFIEYLWCIRCCSRSEEYKTEANSCPPGVFILGKGDRPHTF